MRVTRLHDIGQCRQIAAAWDCMAHSNPFRRTAWLLSWWAHYQSEGELYVLQVTDGQGAVVGIAPWYISPSTYQGRVVRPLGSGEVCTDYLGVLTTAEHESQVMTAVAQWLAEAADGNQGANARWDLLDLVSVDEQDASMQRFLRRMDDAGNRVRSRPDMRCWRVPLPGTWDDYLGLLSKTHRKRIRKIDREWLDNGRARLRCVQSADELPPAMDLLVDLHQRRQASLGQPGCFASSRFSRFLRQAAERMLAEQTLRLYWLESAGQPLAAELHAVGGDCVYAYLAGINPEYIEWEPGRMIQQAIVKQLIGEGIRVFDLLRGDEPYKARWGAEPHACVAYHVVPPRRRAQLRHQIWVAGDTMKQWVKSGLQLTGMY